MDFSSKWETPIICHKEAPEKAIKNSDIFFILFSNFEEEIIISERGDSMTRINKLFSNLGLKKQLNLLLFLFKSCFLWEKKNDYLFQRINKLFSNLKKQTILKFLWKCKLSEKLLNTLLLVTEKENTGVEIWLGWARLRIVIVFVMM